MDRATVTVSHLVYPPTRRHGESYGVGTWREGGEWREKQPIPPLQKADRVTGTIFRLSDSESLPL